MPLTFDQAIEQTGTRFRILVLPRYAEADFAREPETVVLNVPVGSVQAGPADDRAYVVDAPNKSPYQRGQFPPYAGTKNPPVKPGADGHFDKIPVDSREFLAATMYATVRRTLDIWEAYFKRKLPWHFRLNFARIELVPAVNWDNAHSGYGFLEFGYARNGANGPDYTRPYCENFDVLAHELGHSIIYSAVGVPSSPAAATLHYAGFHESAADLTAIVATLHFNLILDHILESSKGNLFSVNELTRVGEVSKSGQVRLAFNYEKMSTVGTEEHLLSLPLTGALFDVFVEAFQMELVARGLITAELAKAAVGPEGSVPDLPKVQAAFAKAYKGREAEFKACLLAARDYFGYLLAAMWERLTPDNFTYAGVGLAALAADEKLTGGKHLESIRSCFAWREIQFPPDSPHFTRFLVSDCPREVHASIEVHVSTAGRSSRKK